VKNILRAFAIVAVFGMSLAMSGCSNKPPADDTKPVNPADGQQQPVATGAVGSGAPKAGGPAGAGVAKPN
jgi:hypothetical protein